MTSNGGHAGVQCLTMSRARDKRPHGDYRGLTVDDRLGLVRRIASASMSLGEVYATGNSELGESLYRHQLRE